MKRTIYLDYNATTPLDPAVRDAMLPFLGEIFGNASSVHHVGRRARALLDDARDRLAARFKSRPSEIVFTSGGTESNNLAVFGAARQLAAKGRHLITSSIEHHAVLHSFRHLEKREGFAVTYLPVNREGIVSPDDFKKALRPDTIFASIMAANNETGSLQPVAEIGALCRDAGIIFHTDAVQSFGKQPFASIDQFNADLVSVCAHKFHGPKGAGSLFIRSPLQIDPILFGGAHENEKRAGTENCAAVIGLVEAFEKFALTPVFDSASLSPLANKMIVGASALPGVVFRGSKDHRLANTAAFTVAACESISLLAGLDLEGVCASSGSACSAGSLEPSHVMEAMGVGKDLSNALVRFSLGRDNNEADVDAALEALAVVIKRVRGR